MVKRHCSVEHKINNITIDVGLEAILLAYNECLNRLTKTQILSLISDKFSQSELQQLLPSLKSVYKSHPGPEEPCAYHCIVFALSDPVEDEFSGERCHDHNQHVQNARVLFMF